MTLGTRVLVAPTVMMKLVPPMAINCSLLGLFAHAFILKYIHTYI